MRPMFSKGDLLELCRFAVAAVTVSYELHTAFVQPAHAGLKIIAQPFRAPDKKE